VDNLNAQPPDSFDNTQYASTNLVWMPTERWLFGIEGLWGKRVDKGGRMEPTFAPSSRPGSLSKAFGRDVGHRKNTLFLQPHITLFGGCAVHQMALS